MVSINDLLPTEFGRVSAWLSDESITKWLTAEWRNRVATPSMIAIAARNRKNRLFLVNCHGVPCGLVGLADIDPVDRTAMIWYLLGESQFARNGVITQAVREAVRVAFEKLELVSLYAWIMEDNAPSRRVLEKAGFKECGRLRKAACSNGRQVDRVYFDFVSPRLAEWQASAPGVFPTLASENQEGRTVNAS